MRLLLGFEKLLSMLIEKGADVNIVNDYNNWPLKLAAEKGKIILN